MQVHKKMLHATCHQEQANKMRYPYIPNRMAKIQEVTTLNAAEDME
jgi:hypothetical protein